MRARVPASLRTLLRAAALAAVCATPAAAAAASAAPAGALLAGVAAAGPSSSDARPAVPPPSFCHGLACPSFAVLSAGDDFQLRRYAPALWVSTLVTGASYDAAVNTGFQRLFDYIGGDNAAGAKIPMTAPVTVDVEPGPGPSCGSNFTVSFFVSNDADAAPPAPSLPAVFLRSAAGADVYVASFGGWADEKRVLRAAAGLAKAMAASGVTLAPDAGFTTAAYDSPFRILDRHNEIWIDAPAPPDAAAPPSA